MLPDDQELEAMAQHEKALKDHGKADNKLNRMARARADSLTRDGSEGERESAANSTLPQNKEGEAMAQHEKESRKNGRLANKSNRILRARVDSLTGEGSKQDSKRMSNMMLLQLQEADTMTNIRQNQESMGDQQISQTGP